MPAEGVVAVSYTVRAKRWEHGWELHIADVGVTQSRTLADADRMVRDYIATRSGIDEAGCYDGTLEFYAYGPHKATAVSQIAEARGYDLDRCYAYSDSVTDLPLLQAVGHPVAVNPDRELRAAARALDWEIRDFHSPVTLRQRLPEPPSTPIMVGLGVAAAAGLAAWWLSRERRWPLG
jgi:hypothetical protein